MGSLELFWLNLYQPISIAGISLAFTWIDILIGFVAPLVVYILLSFLSHVWVKNYLAKSPMVDERKSRWYRIYQILVRILFVFLLIALSSRFIEDRVIKFFEGIYEFMTRPFLNSGISLITLILAVPVFYLASMTGRAARLAFDRSKFITQGLTEKRRTAIASLIRWVVMATVLLLGLSIIGLNLSSIGFFLAIVGFAVALGIWQILATFFAGILITINRTIREGDHISFNGPQGQVIGRVEQMRLMALDIRTPSGDIVMVPSNAIIHGIVRHGGKEEGYFTLALEVPLALGADLPGAEKKLLEIATADTAVLATPAPRVSILAIEPQGIKLELSMSLGSGADAGAMRTKLYREIWLAFKAEGWNFSGALAQAPQAKAK